MITTSTHPDPYENAYWILTRNAVKCNLCADRIQSKHRHDFVSCCCGNVSVDGGSSYVRRTFRTTEFTDESQWTLASKEQVLKTIAHYQAQDWAEQFVAAGEKILKEHYDL